MCWVELLYNVITNKENEGKKRDIHSLQHKAAGIASSYFQLRMWNQRWLAKGVYYVCRDRQEGGVEWWRE